MRISEAVSSDTGPVWFAALAVVAILASAWSATTVDEGMTVPLIWVVPPFALGLVSLGLSGLALMRIRPDKDTNTQRSSLQTKQQNKNGQTDSENTTDSSSESCSSAEASAGTGDKTGPKEVDLTGFADSKQ